MITISLYISIVLLLFLATAVWTSLSSAEGESVSRRLKSCLPLTFQLTICSLGYSVFFFVLMLALGIAVWLVLLGLVYLPADILNNAFGKHWTERIVSSILPYVSRSSHSPGLFHQPILDYSTLCVVFLAPAAGIWSVINRKILKAKSGTQNPTGSDGDAKPAEIKENAA